MTGARRHFLKIALAGLVALVMVLAGMPHALARTYASIVVNQNTGKVMYARNADQKLFPASLTKVMTLYLIFEQLEYGSLTLDTPMKVSKVAASRSPSKLWLRPGDTIRVKEVINVLITKSANDAATVVAEHIDGTERKFAKRMTRKARALGMTRTVFRNASGLPHSKQHSTARDMARLGIAIQRDFPQYFELFRTTHYKWGEKRFRNHNKLLKNFKGTDGIKTGYTKASGFNLLTSAERDGIRLVAVVFGGRTGASRDKHMRTLLTRQFKIAASRGASVIRNASLVPPPPRPDGLAEIAAARRAAEKAAAAKAAEAARAKSIALVAAAAVLPPRLRVADEIEAPPVDETEAKAGVGADNLPGWLIQVGSFENRNGAHLAARAARDAARAIIGDNAARVRPVSVGDTTFWRVRFHGLNEAKAREACARLYEEGMTCIALPRAAA